MLLALAAAAPALAGTITFRAQSWPGNNQVFSIKDDDRHSHKLSCQPGEKVCYGAWVRGNQSIFWGVGFGGKNSCRNCCFTATAA